MICIHTWKCFCKSEEVNVVSLKHPYYKMIARVKYVKLYHSRTWHTGGRREEATHVDYDARRQP
jgi:hypothetical protein